MPRSNETLLRMAGICLPMILAAVAARSVLKSPKNAPTVSAAVPSAEDLDSLGKYLAARPSRGVPVIASNTGFRNDRPDPFVSIDFVPQPDSGAAVAVPVVKPVARDRYVVTAILISSDKRVAVVNEDLVSVGSMLPGGFRVTAIENDHVEIVAPSGVRRLLTIRSTSGP